MLYENQKDEIVIKIREVAASSISFDEGSSNLLMKKHSGHAKGEQEALEEASSSLRDGAGGSNLIVILTKKILGGGTEKPTSNGNDCMVMVVWTRRAEEVSPKTQNGETDAPVKLVPERKALQHQSQDSGFARIETQVKSKSRPIDFHFPEDIYVAIKRMDQPQVLILD